MDVSEFTEELKNDPDQIAKYIAGDKGLEVMEALFLCGYVVERREVEHGDS